MKAKKNFLKMGFEKFATTATRVTGSSTAFVLAFFVVIVWAVTGPIFHYSDTWQLVINTGTTVVTFLMVFLIQKSQNKDSLAIQIKLNELLASSELASNRLVSAEGFTEEELRVLNRYYEKLAEMTAKENNLQTSHSIEEAELRHEVKTQMKKVNKASSKK